MPSSSLWWPIDRIQATLTPEYIVRQLPPSHLPRLVSSLPWGEGLTSETYLDWILTKAGRLFLILTDIGIPERIFALVDASVDDVDLPFAAHSVHRLPLSPEDDTNNQSLDEKFFIAQWRFIVRGIPEGEHVKFTPNEGVPVEVQRTGSALAKEGIDKVILAGAVCRVYLRTQVTIGSAPHFFEEEEVLHEIRSLKTLAHEHVFSIYASYFVDADKAICILFSGYHEWTLGSFLTDFPLPFKRLPKPRRREIMVKWPYCLARGLAWLHAHGQPHRAIRPSNVLVDPDFRIFLGQFEALDTLLPPLRVDDVESYQYGAPECWIRSVKVQETTPQQRPLLLPSGGRTARRPSTRSGTLTLGRLKGASSDPHEPANKHEHDPNTTTRPNSVASQDTAIRIGAPTSPIPEQGPGLGPGPQARFSFALSTTSSSSSASSDGIGGSSGACRRVISSIKRPIFYNTPSIISSSSSSNSTSSTRPISLSPHPTTTPTSSTLQTWHTTQSQSQSHRETQIPYKSDIFSLTAITTDILTTLTGRKTTSFAADRGAKNRTPGRGGGVVDASFHLDRNLPQVVSWIGLLERDAEKLGRKERKEKQKWKQKSGESEIGIGIGNRIGDIVWGLCRVVKEENMLDRDPGKRPSAQEVEGWFAGVLGVADAGAGQQKQEFGQPNPNTQGKEALKEDAEDSSSLPEPVDLDTTEYSNQSSDSE